MHLPTHAETFDVAFAGAMPAIAAEASMNLLQTAVRLTIATGQQWGAILWAAFVVTIFSCR